MLAFDPDGRRLATRELRCGTRVALTGSSGATVEALAPLSRGTVEVTLHVLD